MNTPNFPPYPQSNEEIRSFSRPGEYMACTIVHRCDIRLLCDGRGYLIGSLRAIYANRNDVMASIIENEHLVPALLLIAENGNDRQATIKALSFATRRRKKCVHRQYFRHRNALLEFFVSL